MKKRYFIIIFIFLILALSLISVKNVSASELSDNIDEQMQNIDLSQLDEYISSLQIDNNDFLSTVYSMLKGEYNNNFSNIFGYLFNIFFNGIYDYLPLFLTVIGIAILCGLINNVKNSFLSESVSEIVFFICFASIILIMSSQLIIFYSNTKNIIEKIAKLSEIMSPIILTLMVSAGGNTSALIYKPAVAFLSNGIIHIFLYAIIPLIAVTMIFSVLSKFSNTVKLNKFTEFFKSIIKWLIGISFTVFCFFITIQGISVATFDGVSSKALKYAISNSIPLIGGFLRDGFDLFVAGSVLIKNSIGIGVIITLFYIVISPVLSMLAFSLLLKLVSAVIEPVSDSRFSDYCMSISGGITYLSVSIIAVGFMLFITVLLMILSANAFI